MKLFDKVFKAILGRTFLTWKVGAGSQVMGNEGSKRFVQKTKSGYWPYSDFDMPKKKRNWILLN